MQSQNTKAEIDIGVTIQYDGGSYQFKKTIVKCTEVT